MFNEKNNEFKGGKNTIDNCKKIHDKLDTVLETHCYGVRSMLFKVLIDRTDDIHVYPNYTGITNFKINDLQKRFLEFYLNRVNRKESIIPVVKMRQAGMTTILEEIALREYLSGKKVLYLCVNDGSFKTVEKDFEYKKETTQYPPIGYGYIKCKHICGSDFFHAFNVLVTSHYYDLIIVDEIPIDTSISVIDKTVRDYIDNICKNGCKAIFAMTLPPSGKQYKDLKDYIDSAEQRGDLFRYFELTNEIASRIIDIARFLKPGDISDVTYFKGFLQEALGIA